MQLRILALGNKNVNRRVATSLTDSDIEVICRSETSEAINLLKQEKFDLALVDGNMTDLESICSRITWLCRTPVALVIKGDQTDWNKLRDLDVDGFIPEEARNMELMAHFQAIAHRSICQINKTKILIIEDDEQIQETLKLSFQIYWPEVEVSFATRGEEGVRMACCESVDVILMELILPDISGLDVLNKIRSFTQTPVVILTADKNQETLIKTLRSGANDYVLKPFKQIELMNRLRQFINQGATVS